MAAYDRTLALLPMPYEELDMPTRFGTTHIIASGPLEAQPDGQAKMREKGESDEQYKHNP